MADKWYLEQTCYKLQEKIIQIGLEHPQALGKVSSENGDPHHSTEVRVLPSNALSFGIPF